MATMPEYPKSTNPDESSVHQSTQTHNIGTHVKHAANGALLRLQLLGRSASGTNGPFSPGKDNPELQPGGLTDRRLQALLEARSAIEAEDALKANAIAYVARPLSLATMPHSRPDGCEFQRRNGTFMMSMHAPAAIGLPYGSTARLIVMHLCTEAVRTGQRDISFGDSLSAFMRTLDLQPSGGDRGSIASLKDQLTRLFSSTITCLWEKPEMTAITSMQVATSANIWWTPRSQGQSSLWNSTVRLGEEFFHEVTAHPIPVDLRAVRALRQSPLALDIYVWLTYRMSYLKANSRTISWPGLQLQFGCDYPETPQGLRDFRKQFLAQLQRVLIVYAKARVEQDSNGLILKPSPTHVAKRARKPQ